jgi:hypothetical protein
MNQPIICKELESGYDINLVSGTLSHCCKFEYIPSNQEEIDILGYKYLDFNKETMLARQELAQGIQTKRCKDCWSYENNNQPSWRIQQNKIPRVYAKNVHLNLQISSLCNQTCFYCVPDLSSSINKFDSWIDPGTALLRKVEQKKIKIAFDFNHIIDFVKHLPWDTEHFDLSLTGGEPFIVDKFNENIKYIFESFFSTHPGQSATLNISTNTNVDVENLFSFYEMINILKEKYPLRMMITTSIENLEERAEYVRGGLVWSNFLENFKIHNTNADGHEIRMTINPFTIVNIADFFKYFSDYPKIHFIYNYPFQKFWRLESLDNRFEKELVRLEDYVIKTNFEYKFFPNPWYKTLNQFMVDDKKTAQLFKQAITGIDEVRKTNWRNVFPEYIDWIDSIKCQ